MLFPVFSMLGKMPPSFAGALLNSLATRTMLFATSSVFCAVVVNSEFSPCVDDCAFAIPADILLISKPPN